MPSILCVDDEPTQLILLRFAFERAGFRVLSANNGQEAVELTNQHQPDLILMDLMMPLMDGYQATAAIKSNPALSHIPIVLYTAYDQTELVAQAKAAGAAEVIRKTIPPKALVSKINALLTSYQPES